jgi:putative effector of murein hydrolase LrgA (UPF0299 family)
MFKYVKLWFAVVMSFIFAYGTPIVAAFYLFSSETEGKSFGGMLFFSIVGLTLLFLLFRARFILKKMKMSGTKLFIKLAISLMMIFAGYQFLVYVDTNTKLLAQQLMAVLGGLLIAFPFKLWALKLDREYIERIGVFG